MSESRGSGPVIFTGLYAASILLSIIAVMMHERYGEVPFRNWAPFLQAILSAGAIFAAFAVQERKRQSDLEDARTALREMYIAKSWSMEHFVGWLYERATEGKLLKSILKRQTLHFQGDIDDIRSLSMEKLRVREEIDAVNLFEATCRQLLSHLEVQAESTSPVSAKSMQYWIGQIFRRRQRMLDAFGYKAESGRLELFPQAHSLLVSEIKQYEVDRAARLKKAPAALPPAPAP